MKPESKIHSLLVEAHSIAITEVERRARNILRKHGRCASFCMAMGTVSFYDRKGFPLYPDEPQYLLPLLNFIREFDSELKMTGTPLR